MANLLKFGACMLTAFLATSILGTDGRIIKLDLNSDQDSGFWSEVSCKYSADYLALNNSCPTNLPPDAAAFNGRDGFWSPCDAGECEITYYGHSFPQPKSIKLHGMVGGGGKIIVQGRRSAVGQAYDNDVMNMSSTETDTNPTFQEISEETSEFKDSFAFRFVLEAQTGESIAVLDFIELDLGEDVPEPPTTQAPGPDPEKTEFLLDTRSDVSSNWKEISCNYADIAEDLWVWGCPEGSTESTEDSLGYWAPCTSSSCSFVYQALNDLEHPLEITINGNIEKGSKVVVSRKVAGLNHASVILTSVEVEESLDSWTYKVPSMYDDDLYNITIVSSSMVNNGSVSSFLVDSVLVKVSEPTSTPGDGNEPATTPGAGNEPTSTPGDGNEPATTPGAGNEPTSTPGDGNEPATTPGAGNEPTSTPGDGNEPTSTPGDGNEPATTPGAGTYTYSSFIVTFVAAVLAVAVSMN